MASIKVGRVGNLELENLEKGFESFPRSREKKPKSFSKFTFFMTPLNSHPRKFLGIAQAKKKCACGRVFSYDVNKVGRVGNLELT
jgi:hypothetical protein